MWGIHHMCSTVRYGFNFIVFQVHYSYDFLTSSQVSHTFFIEKQIDRVRLLNEVSAKAKEVSEPACACMSGAARA